MKPWRSRCLQIVYYTCVALLAAARICTGSSFSGTVVDGKTNMPIPGVRVSIGYTDTVTHTGADGYFKFTDGSAVETAPIDVLNFSRHPLDSTTRCLLTIIEGEVFFDYAKESMTAEGGDHE